MREHDLELLRNRLAEIKDMGWIKNQRPGNAGGVGNTLEDLLNVAENNLQMPDFGEWELKSQRRNTSSLLTLFHSEPLPRKDRIVPNILIPLYGWPHKEAGIKYPIDEMSFRQTINTTSYSDRGFIVNIDWENKRIYISFDSSRISDRHNEWREFVLNGVGGNDLSPHPNWTFADIDEKLKTKLKNLMYVRAERKWVGDEEFFKYNAFEAYIDPTLDKFLSLVDSGAIYVDFDARSGHNHGTKFRIKPIFKTDLYQEFIKV